MTRTPWIIRRLLRALAHHCETRRDGADARHSNTESRFHRLGTSVDGRAERASGNARPIRRKIDYSDQPELSDAELASMRRVGRPPFGDVARAMIAIRIDEGVIEALRKEAEGRQIGYQTLINEVLARHVSASK